MIKFMHTADWHIRDIQYGRKFRGDDFRRAINDTITLAIDNSVDFILNGGDTLQLNRPSETMLDFLFDIHRQLQEAGIPMYTVTGNHDGSDPSFLKFPSLHAREPSTKPAGIVCVDHQIFSHGGVMIAAYPAIPFIEMADAVKAITPDPVDIVMWHGAIEDFVPFPMKDSGLMADLPMTPRAWLLGDIHLRARKRTESGALVSYPGPVEMCERGEPAKKFADIYTLDDDWRSKPFPEPVELEIDTRPVLFLTVGDDAQADQALQKIRRTIHENPGRSPMIFCRYEKSQRGFSARVHEIIDPADTIFRAGAYHSTYRGLVAPGVEGARPELSAAAAEVIPPGSPIYELSQAVLRPDIKRRNEIVKWVENTLQKFTTIPA